MRSPCEERSRAIAQLTDGKLRLFYSGDSANGGGQPSSRARYVPFIAVMLGRDKSADLRAEITGHLSLLVIESSG